MSYKLCFSFNGDGSNIASQFLDLDGTNDSVPIIANQFQRSKWYGFTLLVPDDYQGYVEFKSTVSNEVFALFSINPTELENADRKISTINNLSLTGTGDVTYNCIVKTESGFPISNTAVWVSTDVAGKNLVAGTLYTNDFGIATFMLNEGLYYFWRSNTNYKFYNPIEVRITK